MRAADQASKALHAALVLLIVGTLTAGVTAVVRAPGAHAAARSTPALLTPAPVAVDGASVPSPVPAAPRAPVVAPLRSRVAPHLLVVSRTPLPAAVVRRLLAATGARAALQVATGGVRIGSGQTTALGVDPSTFRAWTPQGTAESNPLWQSVAAGEGAVAHAVARAFAVRLGGSVVARSARQVPLRIGSLATTGLPGVGLVVDRARGGELGLRPGTGLLLSAPQRDPEVTAAFARDVVGRLGTVSAVQVDRAASGQWVAPTTGVVTSGFGPRVAPIPGASTFHDGIDIGAPLGTPIYAASDGFVLYAGPASGFGTEIVLSHRGGITTVYGHVSRLLVTSGPVAVGQPIALVGDEGESTGPHLHFEVRVNDVALDPLVWLRSHGVRLAG